MHPRGDKSVPDRSLQLFHFVFKASFIPSHLGTWMGDHVDLVLGFPDVK